MTTGYPSNMGAHGAPRTEEQARATVFALTIQDVRSGELDPEHAADRLMRRGFSNSRAWDAINAALREGSEGNG